MAKIAFITGASAGFGEASARKFASHGWNLILNARREDRLQLLKDELEKEHSIKCFIVPFDVREESTVQKSIEGLPDQWKNIDVLLNNAGLALGRDSFHEASLSDWNVMIDTNVKGLLYVSHAVVPLMVKRKQGHVINLGSVAGKEVYEKGNVYCATKFAVDAKVCV
jgi:3-hydroxy acid dehydrogenase / malonic semialdehyde reductase